MRLHHHPCAACYWSCQVDAKTGCIHCLRGVRYTIPSKRSLPTVGSRHPSNTWFLGLTWFHIPNGISISSANFAGLNNVSNTQADTQTTRHWFIGHICIAMLEQTAKINQPTSSQFVQSVLLSRGRVSLHWYTVTDPIHNKQQNCQTVDIHSTTPHKLNHALDRG